MEYKKNKEYISSKIKEMEEANYIVTFDILNALEFGVPQDRERFFIIGVDKEFAKKKRYRYFRFIFEYAHKNKSEK